ncbi:NAD(P)/FAD-dependent oxidoreductase [Chthonobacter rhizosphaerae]|uniref:NAD(P)/FAD-dependent oxidoreductase n=1 Tax=Chthonobacter rhizosphaerae TaxID=2735553 RepID=UPI0015EF4A69|nr:FAD-dependent oxidoreductase [Chthonobacter rhizosphaerae]
MADNDLRPLDGIAVAVVGAGIAGLTAARKLAKAGAAISVFEKSRGLGGRLATRRVEGASVDHGAQYFTAREPAFKAWVARAKLEGAAASWAPRGKDGEDDWLVGMPGMSGLVTALVDGYTVTNEKRVTAIHQMEGALTLSFEDGTSAPGFDRVVVAVPAPQAAALVRPFGAPFERIADAAMAPCWTLILALSAPFDPGFDVARDRGPLQWIACSGTKPGRQGETIVAQANPAWSREHLEQDAESIRDELLRLLEEAVGPMPARTHEAVHRWRYALVEKAVGETFLLSPDGRIGVCGDWLIAPRVESAWASGDGLADALIARTLQAAHG